MGYSRKILFINERYSPERESLRYFATKSRIKKVCKIIRDLLLRINKGKVIILDIGCYDGTISSYFKRNSNIDVIGCELNFAACKVANTKIICTLTDVEEGLPFRNNMFDIAYMGEVIEHIYDPDFLIDEVYRVLKPAGYLILTTPNLVSLGSRILVLLGKRPRFIEPRITPESAGHIRYFTLDDLVDMLTEHGFKIVKVRGSTIALGKLHLGRLSEIAADLYPRLAIHLIVVASKAC